MPIASRLDWIEREILNGRDAHVAFGPARENGKLKVKILLFASFGLHSLVRDSLLTTIHYVRALLHDGLIVVDRGHKHSNGTTEIGIWLNRVANDSSVLVSSDQPRNDLRADAAAFVPTGDDSMGRDSPLAQTRCDDSSDSVLQSTLRGQWNALPAADWEVVYNRFHYDRATVALRSYCVFAEKFLSRGQTLKDITAHCSDTFWYKKWMVLFRTAEIKYRAVAEIDHSRTSLYRHHETILEVHDLVTTCAERFQDVSLLFMCYPRKFPKRYKFVRPADLSTCRFSGIELADALMSMDSGMRKFWMSLLQEKYRLNHTWLKKEEIERIDPMYLVQQLRPRDRLMIDSGVYEALTSRVNQ
eukprot:TRINITY_DN39431_c1_g1_i1.p1 TRINITY_DN39431_c1_g1~~TRINITY_DN39431_c1_g1_i1.p1  ORF type:complete len:358 (+),score=37.34 TRINITY_DN39431_c1_g1_i1:70-1143(+)